MKTSSLSPEAAQLIERIIKKRLPLAKGEVVKRDENAPVWWGEASKHRGKALKGGDSDIYFRTATLFLHDFPIGSRLTAGQLDEWFAAHGFLTIPPEDTDKASNEWQGHLMKRSAERMRLNKAASHPRMASEFDAKTFSVVWAKRGRQPSAENPIPVSGDDLYEVRSCDKAVFLNEWETAVGRLTRTKKRQMRSLLQGVPWEHIGPNTANNLKRVFRELGYFEEDVVTRAERMNELLLEAYQEVEKFVGPVALRQLLASEPNEENGDSNNEQTK
jgi:hypothetical protein